MQEIQPCWMALPLFAPSSLRTADFTLLEADAYDQTCIAQEEDAGSLDARIHAPYDAPYQEDDREGCAYDCPTVWVL